MGQDNINNKYVGDEKYEESQVKEYYTRYESLFWVKLKAPWPIR